jgi:CHAT domain-containing protein
MYAQLRGLIIICSIGIISCQSTPNAKEKIAGFDSTIIKTFISNGKNVNAFTEAVKQLNQKSLLGSAQYVKYNFWLANSFNKAGVNTDSIKYFYKNIFSLPLSTIEDSSCKIIYCNALYQWAELSYRRQHLENDSVINLFENAVQIDSHTPSLNSGDKKYACKTLGILYTKLGDMKKALQYFYLQKKYSDPNNQIALTGLAINAGTVLLELHKTDSAIAFFESVSPFETIDPILRSNYLITYSFALLQNRQYREAKSKVDEAMQILDTISIISEQKNEKAGMAWKQKGLISLEENHPDTALANFHKSLIQYYKNKQNSNRDLAKIYILMGKACFNSNKPDSALIYYQVALSLVSKTKPNSLANPLLENVTAENVIIESTDGKAAVFLHKFSNKKDAEYLKSAIQCFETGFAAEEKLLRGFSYDESLMRQAKESRKRSEKAIEACYQLYLAYGSAYWAEKAFQFAETSKAIVLQESVRRNLAANNLQTHDTALQKVQLYQQQVSYYEKQLAITPDSAVGENRKLKELLTQAEQNLLMAKTVLLRTHTAYREALLKSDTISIKSIYSKLITKKTSLIEYFWGDSSQYVFQLSANRSINFIKVSNALPVLAKEYISFFSNKNKINNEPQAYEQAAYHLFQALHLDSIANDKKQNLIIIPDGVLSLFPFESLVTKITGSASPREFSYLLLNKQISYGFSAETLIRQAETHSATKGMSCFAPVFAQKERGNTPLLNTEDELNSIKKEKTNGHYFLKENASITNFKKNTGNNIIHIATHARSDTSGGTPVIEFYDSTLYLNEIYNLQMAANLVVLSACETGIGKIDKSEGAMSLARGFYYAGSKNIITSLWSVDDKSTGTLFGNFYHVLDKDNYSSALRESQLAYLHNASETTASPYYWAGFIHIGRTKIEDKYTDLPIWIVITLAGILIILFYRFMQKKK